MMKKEYSDPSEFFDLKNDKGIVELKPNLLLKSDFSGFLGF